jgi:hypothetical protein
MFDIQQGRGSQKWLWRHSSPWHEACAPCNKRLTSQPTLAAGLRKLQTEIHSNMGAFALNSAKWRFQYIMRASMELEFRKSSSINIWLTYNPGREAQTTRSYCMVTPGGHLKVAPITWHHA